MEPTIFIDTSTGVRLLSPVDWIDLDYVRVENDVGTLVLHLPAQNYARSMFYKDGIIEVWRQPESAAPYLDTNTIWLIRDVQLNANPPAVWEIVAYDLNHLLTRRIVDYNPGNTFTEKLAAADDMGKQIISENFGAGASDTTRSIATYLSIQSNTTAAPVIRKSISRQEVLKVLQDIAASSYQSGTYLVFDVVLTNLPTGLGNLQFQFQSFIKQRGADRTAAGGNPLFLGPDFGNMTDVVVNEDASAEITRAIVTGQGVDVIQAVARSTDALRVAESPFGLIEGVSSASGALVAADLTSQANTALRQGVPKWAVTGKIASAAGAQYGVSWNWGDLLAVQVAGITTTCHASVVHVHWDREKGEVVEPTLVQAVS